MQGNTFASCTTYFFETFFPSLWLTVGSLTLLMAVIPRILIGSEISSLEKDETPNTTQCLANRLTCSVSFVCDMYVIC